MCLDLTKTSVIKTAEEDITVYKHGFYVDGYGVHTWGETERTDIYCSSYFRHNYKLNELQPLVEIETTSGKVNAGYHSYVNFSVCKEMSDLHGEPMAEFIIPKGAKYIEGITSIIYNPSIVSETLIFKGWVK